MNFRRLSTSVSNRIRFVLPIGLMLLLVVGNGNTFAQRKPTSTQFAKYFAVETARIEKNCLNDLTTLEDWEKRKTEYRSQLLEMLGLDPMPEKTDLKVTYTKETKGDGFRVRNLHFQSRPHLYVTGNLYIPDNVNEKLPAILYVCGHGAVKKDGVSYGNKVHYHHHGSWFARNGYVCLTIDSLQLGEIEGIHHGTYRYDMWWWLSRGYTPAGVEAWNCVRAIDLLQSLPEVDPQRIGVTGRSGGGAYSWWIAAIDERIKAAVPVAGITDMRNHVVDHCVEGHCDCMYFVNTYQWDYPMLAAMIAPRPLMISNTDSDSIFPLDGVYRTHEKVRRVYQLYEKEKDLAFHITAGPHKDTQELRVHAFRWFNFHLKGTDELLRMPAEKFFEPEDLRVFEKLPVDSINANVHDSFVAGFALKADSKKSLRAMPVPDAPDSWKAISKRLIKDLNAKTFRAFPEEAVLLSADSDMPHRIANLRIAGRAIEQYRFQSQQGIELDFIVIHAAQEKANKEKDVQESDAKKQTIELQILGDLKPNGQIGDLLTQHFAIENDQEALRKKSMAQIESALAENPPDHTRTIVFFRPRGYRNSVPQADQKQSSDVQMRRRYYLLGQTLDGMRVYDIRRAIKASRLMLGEKSQLNIRAESELGIVTALALLDVQGFAHLEMIDPPSTWEKGPCLLNVSRFTTIPALVAVLRNSTDVTLRSTKGESSELWNYVNSIDQLMNRKTKFDGYDAE